MELKPTSYLEMLADRIARKGRSFIPSAGLAGFVLIPILVISLGFGQNVSAQTPPATPTPILRLANPQAPASAPVVSAPVQPDVEAAPIQPDVATAPVVAPAPAVVVPQQQANDADIWPWGHKNPEPKAVYNLNAPARSEEGQVSAAAVPSALNLSAISQVGGAVYRVGIRGDYAYLGMQYRLGILNVSNPAAPTLMGMTGTWPDKVLGVDVDSNGEHAYVAAGKEGLRIIDVTNKRAPIEIGYYNNAPAGGYAWDVKLFGSRVFIADGGAGLQIVDISNPKSPAKKGCFDTPGSAYDVDIFQRTVSGTTYTYAAVADEASGLEIIDVTNPNCSCPCPSGTNPACPVLVGSVDTPGRAIGVVVSGNYAYIADDTDGLVIVDTSNVTAPKIVGTYDTPHNAYAVAVSPKDNLVYIADGNREVIVVDVSDPTKPVYKGVFGACDTDGDCFANDVALDGSYAFVVDPAYGLHVLNAANPSKLSQVYIFNSPAYTYGVQYQGYAYVTAGSAGLRVIEFPNYNVPPIPNYSDPREAGFFDTPGYAYATQISWPYAYVADGDRGLRVVNVSNPTAPHEVAYVDTPGEARDVALYNGFAYVADKNQGVRVIDVRNPENPVETSAPPFNSECKDARAVYANGGYIFVADGTCGLKMFEAAAPEHNTHLDTLGEALDVVVSNGYAYVAAGPGGGLQIVRVSIGTTTNPPTLILTPVGSYDSDGSASAADITSTTLFLADGANGVRMFDVSDPANPVEKGFFDTRGSAGNLRVVLNAIFVADGDGGLQILGTELANVTSKISGRVTMNGAGLAGVTVSDNATHSTVTDTNGYYTITNLAEKTYTITPSKNGYSFSPPSMNLKVPPDAINKNFTAAINCLSGQIVDIKGRPIADVELTISGPANYTIFTDASGNYSQCQVPSGRYTITPAKSKYTFYKPVETVDVPSSAMLKNFVGALPASSPSGVITDSQPTYTWEVVKDAVRYHLLVNGPSGNIIDQWYEKAAICSSDVCMVKPDVTLVIGNYTWQVQTYTPSGTTAFVGEKTFTVSKVGVATLVSPARTITEKAPTFVWNLVEGASKYHVIVSSPAATVMDAWFEAGKVCTTTSCSAKAGMDLNTGAYSWKIQAWSAIAEGAWSEAMEFTIQ